MGNPKKSWCRLGELASALGVRSSTLSVWLFDNREWLAPYRRSAGVRGYLYHEAAVRILHGINKRGTGRRAAWDALRPSPPRVRVKGSIAQDHFERRGAKSGFSHVRKDRNCTRKANRPLATLLSLN